MISQTKINKRACRSGRHAAKDTQKFAEKNHPAAVTRRESAVGNVGGAHSGPGSRVLWVQLARGRTGHVGSGRQKELPVSGCWENAKVGVVDNPSDRSGNAEENQCVSNERKAVTAQKKNAH